MGDCSQQMTRIQLQPYPMKMMPLGLEDTGSSMISCLQSWSTPRRRWLHESSQQQWEKFVLKQDAGALHNSCPTNFQASNWKKWCKQFLLSPVAAVIFIETLSISMDKRYYHLSVVKATGGVWVTMLLNKGQILYPHKQIQAVPAVQTNWITDGPRPFFLTY